MFREYGVPFGELFAEVPVDRVEVQAVMSGDKRVRLPEVLPEFIDRARPARVVAGHLQAASGKVARSWFETDDIVSLPAVDREGDFRERFDRFFGIDVKLGVAFAGEGI